jgi:hypothetical protein
MLKNQKLIIIGSGLSKICKPKAFPSVHEHVEMIDIETESGKGIMEKMALKYPEHYAKVTVEDFYKALATPTSTGYSKPEYQFITPIVPSTVRLQETRRERRARERVQKNR